MVHLLNMHYRYVKFLPAKRLFNTSTAHFDFYEAHRKGRYGEEIIDKPIMQRLSLIWDVRKELKNEFKLWKQEMLEKYLMDVPIVRPGDSQYVYKLNSAGALANWDTVSDKDHNEGTSECIFELSKYRKALFSGVVSTHLLKDGKVQRAGYCNITSKRVRKSFRRDSVFEWSSYTHLVIRLRGDGRPYMLNLLAEGTFDLTWNDMFSYILYTRGGPYWQTVKIPFSRFFLSSKGRIQDKQCEITLDRLTNIGISCSGKVPGPFQLEIDYIAVLFDPNHSETFAYEMYEVPTYVVRQ